MFKMQITEDDQGRMAVVCEPKQLPITVIFGKMEWAKFLLAKQAFESRIIVPVGSNGE